MYCLIISSGAPPTVETKYELIQSVGRRDFNDGNSDRKTCEEAPPDMSYGAVDTVLRVNFDQKMYMVRHDFHFNYFGVNLGGFLCDELL